MNWIRHCLIAAIAVLLSGAVLTVLAISIVTVMLQRGPLDLPQVRALIEDRANKQFSENTIEIGRFFLIASDTGLGNRVLLQDVVVSDLNGAQVITVPELLTHFSIFDLVTGQFAPKDLAIVGAEIKIERDKYGSFTFFGAGGAVVSGKDLLALLDTLDDRIGTSSLRAVELRNTRVNFTDQLMERKWDLDTPKLMFERDGQTILAHANLEFGEAGFGAEQRASMLLGANYILGSENAPISAQFSNVNTVKIAELFESFELLRNLDGPLSGSVRADLSRDYKVSNLHGVLEIAEGRLVQPTESRPITFNEAKIYFGYDHEKDILNLDQIDLEANFGSISGEGFWEFTRNKQGKVISMEGQLRFEDILVTRPDLFDSDIALKEVAVDARLSFWPFKIDVGRLMIFDGDSVIKVSGSSKAGKARWINSYDLDIDKISVKRLKQLWPKPLVHKTRNWVSKNVFSGTFSDIAGGFRTVNGKPNYAFNFNFEKSNFNFLDSVPDLNAGKGFGYLTEIDFRLDLSAGHVMAPNGSKVDVAGSGFFVPDTDVRPTPSEVTLKAKGSIEAMLGLVNVEKFQFLDKLGLQTNLSKGSASISGWFKVPLSQDTKNEDIKLALDAELLNVHSTELIEDRAVKARRLVAKITDQSIILTGNVKVDTVPVNIRWTQFFNEGSRQSKIDARINLTDKNLNVFGVVFPDGALAGSTPARVAINLRRGSPSKFKLFSNLVGSTINISELGWTKDKTTSGQLTIIGSFGQQVNLDNLAFQAPGLEAVGTFEFDKKNRLQRARFSSLNIGKWLRTSAVVTLRDDGHADISLNGGTADLRYFDRTSSSEGTHSSNLNLKLSLDRVRVNNDLSLTAVTGLLFTKGGLNGTFVGRVNGSTQIEGQLFPQKYGTAIKLNSKDAGGVMTSTKLLTNAREGALRIVLIPRKDDVYYDGKLEIQRIRFKDASAMAQLLNGISLVGALQQLEGEGIHFSNIEGQFKLQDNGVKLEKISAVGPSMGMTLNGWYNTRTKDVDFEGVITPFYAVNGVFERMFGGLVGLGKGEGIFSFNYRMRGPAAAPDVIVDPLSILTPGAFREIFRQKPPVSQSQ